MAGGYARASGLPGICLAVCGLGVFNAATPLVTAYTDAIPMLLISGQIPLKGSEPPSACVRSGYYHENDQIDALKTLTKWQFRALRPEALPTEASVRAGWR